VKENILGNIRNLS